MLRSKEDFDFFVGRSSYLDRPQLAIWDVVEESHMALDSVLKFEKELSERELEDREDILFGSLEEILRKLEEKGTEQREIEKYKEMRLWR